MGVSASPHVGSLWVTPGRAVSPGANRPPGIPRRRPTHRVSAPMTDPGAPSFSPTSWSAVPTTPMSDLVMLDPTTPAPDPNAFASTRAVTITWFLLVGLSSCLPPRISLNLRTIHHPPGRGGHGSRTTSDLSTRVVRPAEQKLFQNISTVFETATRAEQIDARGPVPSCTTFNRTRRAIISHATNSVLEMFAAI